MNDDSLDPMLERLVARCSRSPFSMPKVAYVRFVGEDGKSAAFDVAKGLGTIRHRQGDYCLIGATYLLPTAKAGDTYRWEFCDDEHHALFEGVTTALNGALPVYLTL